MKRYYKIHILTLSNLCVCHICDYLIRYGLLYQSIMSKPSVHGIEFRFDMDNPNPHQRPSPPHLRLLTDRGDMQIDDLTLKDIRELHLVWGSKDELERVLKAYNQWWHKPTQQLLNDGQRHLIIFNYGTFHSLEDSDRDLISATLREISHDLTNDSDIERLPYLNKPGCRAFRRWMTSDADGYQECMSLLSTEGASIETLTGSHVTPDMTISGHPEAR